MIKRKHFMGLIVLGLIVAFTSGISLAAGQTVLKVGATPVPHAEVLELVKPVLAEEGIDLQIIEFTDYVRPNLALGDGELDANYFQHIPYLESFSKDHGLDLTYIAKVHIEPIGVYSQKIKDLNELPNNAQIAIPNDPTNAGRALVLLEKAGVIELKKDAGISATVFDITKNPKNIKFKELESAQLPRVLPDVAAAVINTNYALEAGLNPLKDAIFIEGSDSPYVNVLAVRAEDKDDPALQKLAQALTTEAVRNFLLEKYKGAVVPAF